MKVKKVLFLGTVVMALTGNVVGFAQGVPPTPVTVGTSNAEASISFTQGNITLNSVSSFNFGTHTWSIESLLRQEYPLEQNFKLRVTDNRGPGASDGWRVTAKLKPFVNGESEVSLNGAFISFDSFDSNLILPEGGDAGDYDVVTGPTLPSPNDANKIEVISGDDAVGVVAAYRGMSESQETNDFVGLGTWDMSWDMKEINLTILENSAFFGTHTAEMIWTLEDSPLEGDSSNP